MRARVQAYNFAKCFETAISQRIVIWDIASTKTRPGRSHGLRLVNEPYGFGKFKVHNLAAN